MIKVKNLVKKFGHFKAVDNISFKIEKGEIVGFLGPNGAGKTTTMRILAGYMAATSGEVNIDNFDPLTNSIEVRKKIGYLPESTPLYNEMNVIEYLNFLAEMHDLTGEEKRERIKYVVTSCGLKDRLRNEIFALSKGYKQRVGLAQALIHDPDVLILDEPTSGLDPNQIIEIRNLIKEIGKKKTIILSTHILPEVEATCGRVIIINNGKIVGEGSPSDLKKQMASKTKLILSFKGSTVTEIMKLVKEIKGVTKVTKREATEKGATTIEIEISEISEGQDLRSKINAHLLAKQIEVIEMKKEQMNFEEVFAELTKDK